MNGILPWILFNAFVLLMLALDLGVFHKKDKPVTFKEALAWSGVWITLALIFNGWIYYSMGQQPALEYLTGYLIEKSLSVDNIFVFVLLFSFFKIPAKYQHRVLFWGVIGALIMRGIFIAAGTFLITKFHWIIYIFGVFLIYTGYKMFKEPIEKIHPEDNPLVRWFTKKGKATTELHGHDFFVTVDGKNLATPLFLCLLSIEFSDIIFAVDSIPAIFAITEDPFIVYTSNVFAILGLRSLYFALEGVIRRFPYLRYGLAIILVFIGLKMVLSEVFKIPIWASLIFIAIVLVASGLWNKIAKKSRLPHSK
ncbi:TerC family protein [Chitinophagaceae bacterium LB-8]|uniref:TerC family protein n=1 Tax=Paraflavisolibacter caeni TaxID=2982496 RepID=A0A9X3B9I4_9BACT|nr:TerC family protein [Paraflavisolibacter caeni]MCU7552050.1 TerC family protein [Paraflavisolibacter caeni]